MTVVNGVRRSLKSNHKDTDLTCLENYDAVERCRDVNIKSTTFWIAMLFSSGEVHRRFGGLLPNYMALQPSDCHDNLKLNYVNVSL
jgi:hypothetical protein